MRRFSIPAAFLILSLVWPHSSMGQSRDVVFLDIQVIHASSEKEFVDPTLRSLKKKLNSLFNYTSYEIIEKKSGEAAVGQHRSFSLPGSRELLITPKVIKKDTVKLKVTIRSENRVLVNTDLSMERSAIVMMGGPEYRNGVLIILISAD